MAAKEKSKPGLLITRETLHSIRALNPPMVDVNPVSRHVTCCLCGAQLSPQLLRRHWEFFEAEGPAKGELQIRVKGWSCLNGCKPPEASQPAIEMPPHFALHNIARPILEYAAKKRLDVVATGGGLDYVVRNLGNGSCLVLGDAEDGSCPDVLSAAAFVSIKFDQEWSKSAEVEFPSAAAAMDWMALSCRR